MYSTLLATDKVTIVSTAAICQRWYMLLKSTMMIVFLPHTLLSTASWGIKKSILDFSCTTRRKLCVALYGRSIAGVQ